MKKLCQKKKPFVSPPPSDRRAGFSLLANANRRKTTNTKGGGRTIGEERKAWSHAISNSEDVPCTKWPPARRSKGVEKRCWWFIRNTTGSGGWWRARERRVFYRAVYLRGIRTKGEVVCAVVFVDKAPTTHTRR